ncbi:MAG: toll/interleukin-1 receptor domain-containing protein [Parcubacteria group bacterium]
MKNPIEIFFSYAHEDEELMNDVRRQLIVEERNGIILKWHDREIPPGVDWRQQIDFRLEQAAIILLFVSPHFIESRYCYEVEGQAALRRHQTGEARVVPVILRPCLWDRSPFGKLQALPRDAKPVSRWSDRDEACMDVARGVMSVVDELVASRDSARDGVSSRTASVQPGPSYAIFSDPSHEKVELLMPALLKEMREDLRKNPTTREFVVLKRGWIYNSQGPYLAYYFDEHEDLEGKLQVLENLGFVREITYNNVRRFVFEERFVDYLTGAA